MLFSKGLYFNSVLNVMIVAIWLPALTSIGDVNLNVIVTAGLFLSAILVYYSDQAVRARTPDRRLGWLLLLATFALSLFAYCSILWAEEPLRVFRTVYAQGVGAVMLLFFLRIDLNKNQVDAAIRCMIFGALLSSTVAVIGFTVPGLRAAIFGDSDRTAAFFRQSNQLGIALAMSAPIVIGYAATRRGSVVIASLLCGLTFLGLSFSGSKTNLVLGSLLVVVLVILSLVYRGTFRRAPHLAVLAIAVIATSLVVGYSVLEILNPRAKRLLDTFASDGEAPSVTMRQDLWNWSIEAGLERPLTGVGAGQSAFDGRFSHSHNVFVEYFRTLGFPGLILIVMEVAALCVISFSAIFDCIKTKGLDPNIRINITALALSILSYVLSNQTSDSFGPSTIPLLWVSAGLLISYRRLTAPNRLAY